MQMTSQTDPVVAKQGEKRLMVKVIKASGLGLKQGWKQSPFSFQIMIFVYNVYIVRLQ